MRTLSCRLPTWSADEWLWGASFNLVRGLRAHVAEERGGRHGDMDSAASDRREALEGRMRHVHVYVHVRGAWTRRGSDALRALRAGA